MEASPPNKDIRKLLFFIILIVILLGAGIALVMNFVKPSDQIQSESNKSKYFLEMTLVAAPTKVETICSKYEIVLETKNKGTDTLKYSDIASGTYGFSVSDSNRREFLYSSAKYADSNNLLVSDFGEIAPGETKQITLISKTPGSNNANYAGSYMNGFERFSENGDQELTISFEEVMQNGIQDVIANSFGSMKYQVKIDLFRGEYTDTIMKACNNY